MEEQKLLEYKKECCGRKQSDNYFVFAVLLSFVVMGGLLFTTANKLDVIEKQIAGYEDQCVEFSGLGATYWQNECRYGFRKQNMTCESSVDEGKTDDFVWTISKNGTFVNETHMPCTKYIYVKRPSGASSANISVG